MYIHFSFELINLSISLFIFNKLLISYSSITLYFFISSSDILSAARDAANPSKLALISNTSITSFKDTFVTYADIRNDDFTNSLLVVVDTHKSDVTEAPELIDKTEKVMVIDHHRKSVGFIENTVMFYHMPK